ncbi:MAG: hypothetical protein LBI34_00670 [Puniceicoccales bacterium]|jgi:hypothetical protein|nr:hypothetical protein [Puniceicoccales bacterium]
MCSAAAVKIDLKMGVATVAPGSEGSGKKVTALKFLRGISSCFRVVAIPCAMWSILSLLLGGFWTIRINDSIVNPPISQGWWATWALGSILFVLLACLFNVLRRMFDRSILSYAISKDFPFSIERLSDDVNGLTRLETARLLPKGYVIGTKEVLSVKTNDGGEFFHRVCFYEIRNTTGDVVGYVAQTLDRNIAILHDAFACGQYGSTLVYISATNISGSKLTEEESWQPFSTSAELSKILSSYFL